MKRRDFINSLSYYLGSGIIASSVPWMSFMASGKLHAQTGVSDRVNIAMLGIGTRGRLLQTLLQMNPAVNIVAVCDDYPEHLEWALEKTGRKAKGYTDYKKMLEQKDIDAVVIATPLFEHAHMVLDCFSAGKHVFCEKAMAKTIEDCDNMVKGYLDSGLHFQVGHQRMFNIVYKKAFEMVQAGAIGNITQIRAYWHRNNDWRRQVPKPELERKLNWRLYHDYSCGLMTELASHQIQVANWFLNDTPETVMGYGGINYWHDGREVYDNVNLIYNYKNGTRLIYDSMTSNKHYGLEEQIMGPKGTIEPEVGKYFSEYSEPAPGILQLINNVEKSIFNTIPIGGASWIPETAVKETGKLIVDEHPLPNDTQVQMEGFVRYIQEGKTDKELVKQGFYASIATLMGHESMMDGEEKAWPNGLSM